MLWLDIVACAEAVPGVFGQAMMVEETIVRLSNASSYAIGGHAIGECQGSAPPSRCCRGQSALAVVLEEKVRASPGKPIEVRA